MHVSNAWYNRPAHSNTTSSAHTACSYINNLSRDVDINISQKSIKNVNHETCASVHMGVGHNSTVKEAVPPWANRSSSLCTAPRHNTTPLELLTSVKYHNRTEQNISIDVPGRLLQVSSCRVIRISSTLERFEAPGLEAD